MKLVLCVVICGSAISAGVLEAQTTLTGDHIVTGNLDVGPGSNKDLSVSGKLGVGVAVPSYTMHLYTTTMSDGLILEGDNDTPNLLFRGSTTQDVSIDVEHGIWRLISEPREGGIGYRVVLADSSQEEFPETSPVLGFGDGPITAGLGAANFKRELTFYTYDNTEAVVVERMKITADGDVIIRKRQGDVLMGEFGNPE